jgi:hypothetical protein
MKRYSMIRYHPGIERPQACGAIYNTISFLKERVSFIRSNSMYGVKRTVGRYFSDIVFDIRGKQFILRGDEN